MMHYNCENICSVIMCGIAGAVPYPHKLKVQDHVRLGDIVVTNGKGIIQYDRGKQRDSRSAVISPHVESPPTTESPASTPLMSPLAGFEPRSPPRPPSPELLTAVRLLDAEVSLLASSDLRPWDSKIEEFLSRHHEASQWCRPYHTLDVLNDTPAGDGDRTQHPKDPSRRSKFPRLFHGPIGSANVVQSDPLIRNALRDSHGIKAVEMEGSGIADATWVANIGYLVVRGTCDYCNATKNDRWHNYAALIAAAYTCTVIEHLCATGAVSETAGDLKSEHSQIAALLAGYSSKGPVQSVSASTYDGNKIKANPSQSHSPRNLEVLIREDMVTSSSESTQTAGNPQRVNDITMKRIDELVERGAYLLAENDLITLDACVTELEPLLTSVPQNGSGVRGAWILLAKTEARLLAELKKQGKPIDATRLNRLRQKGEHVVD